MQLIHYHWLNTRFFGKFLNQKKYKLNNFFLVPRIHQIVVSTPISKKENKHIDIAFWFLSILFQKQDFTLLTKTMKRGLFGKQENLVGLVLHLTGKNLFWKLKKIVNQLLPPQEYRYKFFVRSLQKKTYNFSFRNLTTYPETQMIYNDPKRLLISDLALNFNFCCSTKNVMHFYLFFKLLRRFPVKIASRVRRLCSIKRYRKSNNHLLWNLVKTKLRERRYFKYKTRRLKRKLKYYWNKTNKENIM